MNILGYSGLHNSDVFKKTRFPNLSARDLLIATGHDSAAALVSDDGIVAAAAEERFSREKATGRFPHQALEFCLRHAALDWDDIDYLAHGFAYEPLRDFFGSMSEFEKTRFEDVYSEQAQIRAITAHLPASMAEKLVEVPHHLAHAASAFYPSGMKNALIVVTDGMGEVESCTVAIGSPDGIEIVKTIASLHSLGMLYSVVTLHLGFAMSSDEYKVMGLAAYGDARRTLPKFMELIQLRRDGTYSIPCLLESGSDLEQETLASSRAHLSAVFGPPRDPGGELTRDHMDIAAGMQTALQTAVLHLLRHFRQETGLNDLCLSGGVTLNCAMNGVIGRSRLFRSIYVQPAAGDDGTALGAALYVKHSKSPTAKTAPMGMPFLGPSYSDDEIGKVLDGAGDVAFTHCDSHAQLCELSAKALQDGKIVGWFQGRMEYGPRALGARSILANPCLDTTKDRVNMLIKKRENFRPFAPAVLHEHASKIFNLTPGTEDMYENMLFVAPVRPDYRDKLPATTHVDGSARVQVVSASRNAGFHKLIQSFAELSGMPVVLNTSFNVNKQPIVCSPQEALDTFRQAGLDCLAIGPFWVEPTGTGVSC
ncbi:carbamoyltransferase family protein [Roseivivax sp. CAU 1753]